MMRILNNLIITTNLVALFILCRTYVFKKVHPLSYVMQDVIDMLRFIASSYLFGTTDVDILIMVTVGNSKWSMLTIKDAFLVSIADNVIEPYRNTSLVVFCKEKGRNNSAKIHVDSVRINTVQ